jgi:hypothetical protein
MCPNDKYDQGRISPISLIVRLSEASYLLDKIHTTLHSPTEEHAFSMEELNLAVQALTNLQTILNEEIGNGSSLYAGGLVFCNT